MLRLMGGGGGGSAGLVTVLTVLTLFPDLLLGLTGILDDDVDVLGVEDDTGQEKSLTISDSLISLSTLEDLENGVVVLD